MSEEQSEQERIQKALEQLERSAPIFQQIGQLASDWALLELIVNECLWRLADVTPVLGACITAQIYTINNRLFALISLMRLRKFPEDLVKQVNKFAEDIRERAEKRNRAIHDAILVAPETQRTGRLEVTAQRRPVFEVVPITADEVKLTRLEINDMTNRFMILRAKILEMLPTLPEIPKTTSLPIDLSVVVPMQDQSSGRK